MISCSCLVRFEDFRSRNLSVLAATKGDPHAKAWTPRWQRDCGNFDQTNETEYLYIYIAILGCLGAFQICMEPETDMFLLGETNIYQEVAGFTFQS